MILGNTRRFFFFLFYQIDDFRELSGCLAVKIHINDKANTFHHLIFNPYFILLFENNLN